MTSREIFILAGRMALCGGAMLVGTNAAFGVGEKVRSSARLKAAAVRGVTYDPAIRQRALDAATAAGEGVVQMERYVYTDTKMARAVEAVIAQQDALAEEKRFKPEVGGQFWEGKVGTVPATLGFEPLRDVMNGGTKFNGDPEMFRWNIFQLKL